MYKTAEWDATITATQPLINTDNTDITDNKDDTVSHTCAKQIETNSHLSKDPLQVHRKTDVHGVSTKNDTQAIPPIWNYLKLDLFDVTPKEDMAFAKGRKLKLNLCAYNHTSKRFNMVAMLTTEWWRIKHDMDFADRAGHDHYAKCKEVRDALKANGYEQVLASKVLMRSQKGKGATIHGIAVVVCQLPMDHKYVCALIYDSEEYLFVLDGSTGQLTDAQRKAQIIATWESRASSGKPRLTTRNAFE